MRRAALSSLALVLTSFPTVTTRADEPAAPGIDPAARALLERYQCARCHDGLPVAPAADDRHCVRCHRRVLDGSLPGVAPRLLARYRSHLRSLDVAPSLAAIGTRLRRAWVRDLLADRLPHRDFRPSLPATMPRLPLGDAEAETLAAALVPVEDRGPAPADASDGERLWRRERCGRCHRFTGAPVDQSIEIDGRVPDAIALAPDLAHTRARFQPGALARFLLDPQAFAPGTAMPRARLDEREAARLAAWILDAPLASPAPSAPPTVLPLLSRRVRFAEVSRRVLRKVCWHCHSQPDYALGDGGPGNSGGFGFAPRGLDLSSYSGAASGALGGDGRRHSIFALRDGVPDLVARLVARQREEAGWPTPGYRGMPLGLPALSPEEVQLVASWIAQGRPE